MATGVDAKTFKQDMVVSVRYRNDLPPPPMPPKLLEIEHEGISQYLTTGYASGLARREQPNIDVDAEGGMPIDMVGMPGYFLGDESSIMAAAIQPALDAADASLMLTPEQLRTESTANQGHAFLRRTQYMNAANAKASGDMFFTAAAKIRKPAEKVAPMARDNPENIRRNIQKGFDLAYPDSSAASQGKGDTVTAQERHVWRTPTHPTNSSLKPVGFFPVLPDLGANTDGGSMWNYVKFSKPPFPAHHDKRDDRIDAGILLATANSKELPAWKARKEAFDRDPQSYEDPGPEPYIWSLHVPRDRSSVKRIRKLLNDGDVEKDNAQWLADLSAPDAQEEMRLPFPRARVYHTANQEYYDPQRFMALSFFDPDQGAPSSRLYKQGRAAYYYPIWQRDTFKAERSKVAGANRPGARPQDDDVDHTALADELMILPYKDDDIPAIIRYGRGHVRAKNDKYFAETAAWQATEQAAHAEQEKMTADQTVAERGILQEGAGDVSVAEINDVADADIQRNEAGREDRDDDGGEIQDEDGDGDTSMRDD